MTTVVVALLLGTSVYADTPAGVTGSTNATSAPAPKKKDNKGTIENSAFSVGASNPTTAGSGTGAGAGKAPVGDINVSNGASGKSAAKNPCAQPHPPRDCAQHKPNH